MTGVLIPKNKRNFNNVVPKSLTRLVGPSDSFCKLFNLESACLPYLMIFLLELSDFFDDTLLLLRNLESDLTSLCLPAACLD